MNTIRNINTLLTVLYVFFKSNFSSNIEEITVDPIIGKCLCTTILYMKEKGIISAEEHSRLDLYIDKNQPFTFYNLFHSNGYYWKPYKTEPRLRWLKKHIKKTLKQ